MAPSQPRASAWGPPANYQPLASAVPGITVYAPRPTEGKAEAPVTFKCPNCGASTKYDVASGGAACEHCGYTAPVSAERVGQRAAKMEFTLEALSKAERGWGVSRREMRCDSCGVSNYLCSIDFRAVCCPALALECRSSAASPLLPIGSLCL